VLCGLSHEWFRVISLEGKPSEVFVDSRLPTANKHERMVGQLLVPSIKVQCVSQISRRKFKRLSLLLRKLQAHMSHKAPAQWA
jgi:hypothetical protein